MKIWRYLAVSEQLGHNLNAVARAVKKRNNSNCAALVEEKYKFIGDKNMSRFCNRGCSVECLSFYLEERKSC